MEEESLRKWRFGSDGSTVRRELEYGIIVECQGWGTNGRIKIQKKRVSASRAKKKTVTANVESLHR